MCYLWVQQVSGWRRLVWCTSEALTHWDMVQEIVYADCLLFPCLAVKNSWLLHRPECKDLGKQCVLLLHFKMELCTSLIVSGFVNSTCAGWPSFSTPKKGKTKTTEAGMLSESVRYDIAGHLLDTVEKGLCSYEKCTKGGANSHILCVICTVRSCLNGDRYCFMSFLESLWL